MNKFVNKTSCFVMTILCLFFFGEIVLATEKNVDYKAISAQIAISQRHRLKKQKIMV